MSLTASYIIAPALLLHIYIRLRQKRINNRETNR